MLRFPFSSRFLRCTAFLAVSAAALSGQEKTDGDKTGPEKTEKPEAATEKAPVAGAAAATPQVRRAVAAMRAGQWKAARTAWKAVVSADPANPAALSNLGKVLYQLQDYPAAQSALEKATALKPSLSDSWLTLGLTHLARQQPMLAVSCMTRGVAENPENPDAHNSLAIVLKRIGWADGAEAELQKALDLNPGYSEAHFNLAVMYLERTPPSLEMATRHYRRARELGAAPDELVEKQLQGETVIVEEKPDSGPPPAPAPAPAAAASPAGGSAEKPAASAAVSTPDTPSGAAAARETSPARSRKSSASQPPSPPRKSSPKS
ncbi:MAG: tetratricopeptide repeat protein [Verrucomicrobiota bacterium]